VVQKFCYVPCDEVAKALEWKNSVGRGKNSIGRDEASRPIEFFFVGHDEIFVGRNEVELHVFRIIVHWFHFRRKCFSFMVVMYEGYGFMVACIIHVYSVVVQRVMYE
jgi:hypothetical protein